MIRRKNKPKQDLEKEVVKRLEEVVEEESFKYSGPIISTGSTLLDLAISGDVHKGGGLEGGILVEIFGPSGCGKTVMLCEIAGAVQRQGGQVMFRDPEARLDKQFARLFDLNVAEMEYDMPDTVPEVFAPIREWEPEPDNVVHGIFVDSLAALSTDMELSKDGDKMGMRRAKEFSEELRKVCVRIKHKNFLIVCSNQVRENINAGKYEQKYNTTGGKAIGFYASVRLRCSNPTKIKKKWSKAKGVNAKVFTKTIGVQTEVEVFKNSISAPYAVVPVIIMFDYGIDDIRANLQYVKDMRGSKIYCVGDIDLDKSIEKSIIMIEERNLEIDLREEVITLWQEFQKKFRMERKRKKR